MTPRMPILFLYIILPILDEANGCQTDFHPLLTRWSGGVAVGRDKKHKDGKKKQTKVILKKDKDDSQISRYQDVSQQKKMNYSN